MTDPFRDYETLLHRWKAQQAALNATLDGLLALRARVAAETPPSPPVARSRPLSYTRGMEVPPGVDPWEAP